MITFRNKDDRGITQLSWLTSYHSFSFGDYRDPKQHHYRALRVINEDIVQPNTGFDLHPHRDMEILTYVLSGELSHKDSMGNHGIIRAGELQAMSAGTGIMHSEYNASTKEPVHLLQIWIIPKEKGIKPKYATWAPMGELVNNAWHLLVSSDGQAASLSIHQDVKLYLANLQVGNDLSTPIAKERFGWLQVAKGKVALNKHVMAAGDAAAFSGVDKIIIQGIEAAELLLFSLV